MFSRREWNVLINSFYENRIPAVGWFSMDASNLAIARSVVSGSSQTRWPGVVLQLALGTVVAFGFARFDYALLLPFMRADLGWSYAQAGALNTVYSLGYLIGALLAVPVCASLGLRRSFTASMLLSAILVGASGLFSDLGILLTMRGLTGVAGAVLFVAGAALTAEVSHGCDRATLAFGLYCAGAGFGMSLSALFLPTLVDAVGWRCGWMALGALSLIAALIALPGLSRPASGAPPLAPRTSHWPIRMIAVELLGYGLFGVGYIAYATFIVAYLRSSQTLSSTETAHFWALFGASAVGGAFAWGPIQARLRGGWGAACTIAVVAAGAGVPLISSTRLAADVSAVMFGGSFLAVVAAVTSFAQRVAPRSAWTRAIGALTIAVGIGQCIGPVLTGWLSDRFGTLQSGLALSVLILFIAAALLPFQHETDLPP